MKSFLESEFEPVPAEQAAIHVLLAPYEATVSYAGGTRAGPEAIIEASQQLEAFDGIGCPGNAGICTRTIGIDCNDWNRTRNAVGSAVGQTLKHGAFPLLLGGEHTVSFAAVEAIVKEMGPIGVVQFDAHADLRPQYTGTPWSHACVMRRISELKIPIFQIGVRSLSAEEHAYRQRTDSINFLDTEPRLATADLQMLLPDDFPSRIYVTFDIDAFDCSLMPATGTPEPGGLMWWDAVRILDYLFSQRDVVGADVVELSPIPGLHHCEFTAAKLAYTLMGLRTRQQST